MPDLVLNAHQNYHFALSFGPTGLQVWLDGQLVAAEPEFRQGLAVNDHALVIGGSRAWRSSDNDPAHSLLKGEIGDVMIFDKPLNTANKVKLAGAVDPTLGDSAAMAAAVANLAPLLTQVHHASDTLKAILAEYGIDAHGHFAAPLAMQTLGKADNIVDGSAGADGIDAGRGGNVVSGLDGDDVLQGGYGDDALHGSAGNDILDGGHGQDRLSGGDGDGDDLLISRADARQPKVGYDRNRDEGDPLGELTDGKLYPDQPIPGNDGMTGGAGVMDHSVIKLYSDQGSNGGARNDDKLGSITVYGIITTIDALSEAVKPIDIAERL